jgi:hypothetical protein
MKRLGSWHGFSCCDAATHDVSAISDQCKGTIRERKYFSVDDSRIAHPRLSTAGFSAENKRLRGAASLDFMVIL